jgi:hypothetical protein
MLVAKRRKPTDKVFLNVPYDSKFERLFLAFIAGVSAFGLLPRATLEIATSSRRLDRIVKLIGNCRYSIHDLSRVELDQLAPRTPRFNMPFELGLAVSKQKSLKSKPHDWYVCESENFRLMKSLSDLNGTDPFIHNGTVNGVFRELCNMFRRPVRQPTVRQMRAIYRDLRKNLPVILRGAGSQTVFNARVFKDLCVFAGTSADALVK